METIELMSGFSFEVAMTLFRIHHLLCFCKFLTEAKQTRIPQKHKNEAPWLVCTSSHCVAATDLYPPRRFPLLKLIVRQACSIAMVKNIAQVEF